MEYLLIGTLLGSLVTSEHKDRESCEGRATLLREAKASVRCVEKPVAGMTFHTLSPGTMQLTPNACSIVTPSGSCIR